MNPLAAIRAFVPPEARATLPADATGAPIPAADLKALAPSALPKPLDGVTAADGSFANVLGQLVNDVSAKQSAAAEAVNGLMSGQNVSLHQAMIAMEEASVSFQLMVEVRNRLLESYQELMRMQV